MPKSSPEDYAEFYRFWLWEYTKRNPEFKSDYKALSEGTIDAQIMNKYGFNIFIPSPGSDHSAMDNQYQDSSSILNDVLQGRFEYKIPGYTEQFIAVNPADNGIIRNDWLKTFTDKSHPMKLLAVDFDQPLKIIIDEISFHHTNYHGNPDLYAAFDTQLRQRSGLQRLPHGEKNLPRAIGLWLWDERHINKKKMAESYNKLYEILRQHKKFDLYPDDRIFKKFLKNTRYCINNRIVYPLG